MIGSREQGKRASMMDTFDGGQPMVPGGGPAPGMVVAGKFALQREIASGGMGVVFEGRDLFIERPVAIKLMHPELNEDPVLVARFRREAQAAARIQHPNVVTVHEVGKRRDGTFYIVQELLVGQTLRELLDERGRLEASEVFSIALPVLGGLVAAHIQSIVHRDIKPDNIILAETPSGEIVPKLIDFGIAKLRGESLNQSLTNAGTIMGTPEYMAPEQVRGERVDARADVWAMGVVLYEMLSGSVPFQGSMFELLQQIMDRPIPPLAERLPENLGAIASVIQRALSRDLGARFQTMAEFREELLTAYGRWAPEPAAVLAPLRLTRASIAMAPTSVQIPEPDWVVAEEDDTAARVAATLAEKPKARAGKYVDATPPSIRVDIAYDPIEMAEQSLSVNALHEAIGWAEIALPAPEMTEESRGRALMVLAVAHLWLGDHADAARAAQGALARLARGSLPWHAAFDHLVTAYGYLGRTERLLALVDDLRRAEEEEDEDPTSDAHIVSLCRLSVFVHRAGVPALAERLLEEARAAAKSAGKPGLEVRGWLDVARAEVALHGGHLAPYMRSVELAIDHFTSAGDVRSACLERSNVGNAYAQIGAWDRAVASLKEALSVAEPMQLEFAAAAKAKLGYALAHTGRVEEGIAVLSDALAACLKHGNRRSESLARVYLARLLAHKKDEGAQAMARKAVDAADGLPARRAYALATLAVIMMDGTDLTDAVAFAVEAQSILERLGGVEEGESLIRLVNVLANRLEGKEEQARRLLSDAKRRLIERADRLGDPEVRRSFLERVPDHARILALAERAARG